MMEFKVPRITAVNKDEHKPDKYVLPFAPELVDFITNNMKLTTYRFGDKYNYLNVGDIVSIQNSTNEEILLKATITGKSKTVFADLPLEGGGHESYENKEHQRKVLSGYYKYIGREIKDDDDFIVITFELLQ